MANQTVDRFVYLVFIHQYQYDLPDCKRGCKALDDNVEMKNATYVGERPVNKYMSQGIYYWPSGTVVETNCKPGLVAESVLILNLSIQILCSRR